MHTSQGFGFPDSSVGKKKKNPPATQETPVWPQESTRNCLEKV